MDSTQSLLSETTIGIINQLTAALSAPARQATGHLSPITDRDGAPAIKIVPAQLDQYLQKIASAMKADPGHPPAGFEIKLRLATLDVSNAVPVIPPGRYPRLHITFPDVLESMTITNATFSGGVFLNFGSVGAFSMSDSVVDGAFELRGSVRAIRLHGTHCKGTLNAVNIAGHSVSLMGANRFDDSVTFGALWLDGNLRGCIFGGMLDLSGASLSANICRGLCLLKQLPAGSTFKNATFEGLADFSHCTFKGPIDFEGAKFEAGVDFYGSQFCGEANLKAQEFGAHLSLKECSFLFPPLINAETLGTDSVVSFRRSRYASTVSDEDLHGFRRLRQIAGAQKDDYYQNEFFALEQKTIANLEIARNCLSLNGWVSRAYGCFSFYGQRFVRPAGWWLGLVLVCWTIYWFAAREGLLSYRDYGATPSFDVDTFLLMLNTFLPFMAIRETALQMTAPWLIGVSLLHSALSLIFIALTLLALRRRFSKGQSEA